MRDSGHPGFAPDHIVDRCHHRLDLKEMQALFDREAKANQVYPLIDWSDLFPGFKKFQEEAATGRSDRLANDARRRRKSHDRCGAEGPSVERGCAVVGPIEVASIQSRAVERHRTGGKQ